MSSNVIDIRTVAKLAKLPLDPTHFELLSNELAKVIDLVNKLQTLDTTGILPTSHVTGLENVTREDEVMSSLSQADALSNAHQAINGFFVVPAIFETYDD